MEFIKFHLIIILHHQIRIDCIELYAQKRSSDEDNLRLLILEGCFRF